MNDSKKTPVFSAVRSELDFPGDESRILAYWKSHGILKATFEILPRLPEVFAQGLFATPASYQAVMRFSERMMCLDAGKIIAIGAPAEVMANQRVQEAYLGS